MASPVGKVAAVVVLVAGLAALTAGTLGVGGSFEAIGGGVAAVSGSAALLARGFFSTKAKPADNDKPSTKMEEKTNQFTSWENKLQTPMSLNQQLTTESSTNGIETLVKMNGIFLI